MLFRYLSAFSLMPFVAVAEPHLCQRINPNENPSESVQACSKQLKLEDLSIATRATALADRGIAYRELRELERSTADLKASLALVRDTSTMRMLAWTYREMGRSSEAEDLYTDLLSEDQHWQGWLSRCVVRQDLERFEDALGDCLEALNRDPENIDALYFTARAYNFIGRPGEALPLAEEAIELEPADPRHIVEQVWALYLMGQGDYASETARRGLSRFPGNPGLSSFLAEVEVK